MFGFNDNSDNSSKTIRVKTAVEYLAPHWVVLIQNPGHKKWVAVRSATKKVIKMNDFGEMMSETPAVESFPTERAAEDWIKENITVHNRAVVNRSELKVLFSLDGAPATTA